MDPDAARVFAIIRERTTAVSIIKPGELMPSVDLSGWALRSIGFPLLHRGFHFLERAQLYLADALTGDAILHRERSEPGGASLK